MPSTPYTSDQIDWLRPPEVEGEAGDWTSLWLLSVASAMVEPGAPSWPDDVERDLISFELVELAAAEVRLEIRSRVHPLDLEGYPVIDAILLWLHEEVGIDEINGSERSKWRPFR